MSLTVDSRDHASGAPGGTRGARDRARVLRDLLVPVILASVMALAPPQTGATDRSGHGVRVTVHGGRVSVFAEAAPIQDIVRAMADRTGIEISLLASGRFVATVTIEQEPLDRALERVLRAVSPAANAYSVFSYAGDRLKAVKVVFRPKPGTTVADEADADAPSDRADARVSERRFTEEQRRMLVEELRQAGVAVGSIDLVVVEELVHAGVSMPEILEQLRVAARDPDAAPEETLESRTDPVSEPLSAVDRQTLTPELRAAGVAEPQLDESHLLAARQLQRDGVPLQEIVETLRATNPQPDTSVPGADDAPAPVVLPPPVSGEAGRMLSQELGQAGVPEAQLDEGSLMVAQELKAAGVPIEEIRDNLDAIKSDAARD